MIAIDTNVFLYRLDRAESQKRRIAARLLRDRCAIWPVKATRCCSGRSLARSRASLHDGGGNSAFLLIMRLAYFGASARFIRWSFPRKLHSTRPFGLPTNMASRIGIACWSPLASNQAPRRCTPGIWARLATLKASL